MYRVVWVGGREGAWWLPAGGMRASQGTFSSKQIFVYVRTNNNAINNK